MENTNVISQENIDSLRENIKNPVVAKSIIHIKPNDILRIEDAVLRQKEISRFRLLEEFYVKPYKDLLILVGQKIGKHLSAYEEADNLSISERVNKLLVILAKQGVTSERLSSIVPKTEEEFDFLIAAQKKGYVMDPLLSTEDKMAEAERFLSERGIDSNNGRTM